MTVFDSDRHYVFGIFILDPVGRVLLQVGTPVPLRPKTFDVLVALVEHRGEVLDKNQLFNLVWQGAAIPVGESFEVTTFQTPARMLLPRIMQLHMALANHRIILPMTDVSASIWVLDNVGEP